MDLLLLYLYWLGDCGAVYVISRLSLANIVFWQELRLAFDHQFQYKLVSQWKIIIRKEMKKVIAT